MSDGLGLETSAVRSTQHEYLSKKYKYSLHCKQIIFQERTVIRNVSKYKVLQIEKSKFTNFSKSQQYFDTVPKCTVRVQAKQFTMLISMICSFFVTQDFPVFISSVIDVQCQPSVAEQMLSSAVSVVTLNSNLKVFSITWCHLYTIMWQIAYMAAHEMPYRLVV